MAITTQPQESTQITATISVRVPQNTEADLITAAQERLDSFDVVRDADVTGFDAIDPRLSATVVTVAATIDTRATVQEFRDELTEEVAIEEIDQLTKAPASVNTR